MTPLNVWTVYEGAFTLCTVFYSFLVYLLFCMFIIKVTLLMVIRLITNGELLSSTQIPDNTGMHTEIDRWIDGRAGGQAGRQAGRQTADCSTDCL